MPRWASRSPSSPQSTWPCAPGTTSKRRMQPGQPVLVALVPLSWRATTRQVCGLYPWGSPGQLPLEGAPIGRHLRSGAVVCFDHVSWFLASHTGSAPAATAPAPRRPRTASSARCHVRVVTGHRRPHRCAAARRCPAVRASRRSTSAALVPGWTQKRRLPVIGMPTASSTWLGVTVSAPPDDPPDGARPAQASSSRSGSPVR
jgi:hypothetical protein